MNPWEANEELYMEAKIYYYLPNELHFVDIPGRQQANVTING